MKLIIIFFLGAFIITSCNKDDEFSSAVHVQNQVLVQNAVFVTEASYENNFWAVLYRDTDNSIIGARLAASGGSYFNFTVVIDEGVAVSDNEYLRLALHEDNGTPGIFDYTGVGGSDQPIVKDGNVLEDRFFIREPFLGISDQAITNDSLRVDSVVTGVNSWISVFTIDDNGEPDDQVGLIFVPGGISRNFRIALANTTLVQGTNLITRLHLDVIPYESFSELTDLIEIFNVDSVKQTITLQ